MISNYLRFFKNQLLFTFFLLFLFSEQTNAQLISLAAPSQTSATPQLQWSGTGIGTSKLLQRGNGQSSGIVDFSDSQLTLTGSQDLFNEAGVGSFNLGTLMTDDSNSGVGSPLFIHEAFLDYQSKEYEFYFGRTDNPANQLISFPTIRTEDFILFSNILDPFSNGKNIEEHRYSNVAALVFNQNLSTFENFHAQYLVNSQTPGVDSSVNSYGAIFQYMSPPARDALQFISQAGFGYEYMSAYSLNSPSGMNSVYAGGVVNLNQSITDRVDIRLQDIVNFGNSTSSFQSVNDTFQADNNSATAAVRYLRSPFGIPGYQVSLTGGYKTYRAVANSNSYEAALTGVKRLGQGFDAVAQYSYLWRNSMLANQYNGAQSEQIFTVGLAFDFTYTLNQHIAPRRSLLNFQHQYIPN
jgi:hypothetical protein